MYSDLVSGTKETPKKDLCLFHVSELGEAKNSDKILVLLTMKRFGETNIY